MKSRLKEVILTISICVIMFIIGHVSGLYFGFPNTITLDYGDNMVKVTDSLKVLYNQSFNINNLECPDCNCDCLIKDINNMVCFDESKYDVIRRIQ